MLFAFGYDVALRFLLYRCINDQRYPAGVGRRQLSQQQTFVQT